MCLSEPMKIAPCQLFVHMSLLYSFFQKMAFVRVLLLEVLCLSLFITINAKAVDSESKASFVISLRMRRDIGLALYARPSVLLSVLPVVRLLVLSHY